MPHINNSDNVNKVFSDTVRLCQKYRHEFITPEHLLRAILEQQQFVTALEEGLFDYRSLKRQLDKALSELERVPDDVDYKPTASVQTDLVLEHAYNQVRTSDAETMDVPHLVNGILQLDNSTAHYLLSSVLGSDEADFMSIVISEYGGNADDLTDGLGDGLADPKESEKAEKAWKQLVTCINDHLKNHNPLIGRENELERTIQVLCRREKNNPLHIGEPGVGKTALVYGLAAKIEDRKVPDRLQGSHIYQLDIGTLLAGTQFRGDFEKRLKTIMDGIQKEGNAIVYIDEIHTLVGAGQTGEGAMDASNMLKPYLESGDIRFIGSTTYEEYNRYFSRSKGIVRRFQQIDIGEPSVDETIAILRDLRSRYEQFHQVKYTDEALEYAVRASAKYVNDRFLPDKAIDLIDEAGAWRQLHPDDKGNMVDKELITNVLSKVCKVEAMAMNDDNNAALETLYERVSAQVYGQDEAVRQVVEAIQMSKAGLLDDEKPLASLLFVGPTGVGKTEVARVLASELGIPLVRFDMSEYTEKHTVAKLIGSPAGYVGYEDGGLLTDAIRKSPNCVLLLDEIEKAHSDIYNILLQVMDYARLTDNKGRKADFRNVALLMTSNAGAQFAAQASIGFGERVPAGEAMLRQVKKTFKPEFINRLTATIVFNDMDRQMASLILDKKLRQLQQLLTARKVTMHLSDEAREWLLEKGFTREYGGREIDRVIGRELKPLLMREILFGGLRNGGEATISVTNDKLSLK